ncbi:MAG: hypothetical protein WCI37_03165 [bacterium]
MNNLFKKIKPIAGFSHLFHFGLNVLLPLFVFIFVRLNFTELAVMIIFLSKWRMFAVKPRFWAANIRANSVDIIVGLSIIVFMFHSSTSGWQLIWALVYAIWLTIIKPAQTSLLVSVQSLVAQLFGLMAIYSWDGATDIELTILTGFVCFLSARHFFDNFEEPYARLMSYTWGYFGAALAWILSYWLLFYGTIAQPTLIITIVGYSVASIYYLNKTNKLNKLLQTQFLLIMITVVIVILVFGILRLGNNIT